MVAMITCFIVGFIVGVLVVCYLDFYVTDNNIR